MSRPAVAAATGGAPGSQGSELLAHRAPLFDTEQRMVFGATTFRQTAAIMSSGIDPNVLDEWNVRTMRAPATVISSTLTGTLGWPDVTIGPLSTEPISRRAAATSSSSRARVSASGQRSGSLSRQDRQTEAQPLGDATEFAQWGVAAAPSRRGRSFEWRADAGRPRLRPKIVIDGSDDVD